MMRLRPVLLARKAFQRQAGLCLEGVAPSIGTAGIANGRCQIVSSGLITAVFSARSSRFRPDCPRA